MMEGPSFSSEAKPGGRGEYPVQGLKLASGAVPDGELSAQCSEHFAALRSPCRSGLTGLLAL